jgi:DNA-binding FrmR family transcriptional regulator
MTLDAHGVETSVGGERIQVIRYDGLLPLLFLPAPMYHPPRGDMPMSDPRTEQTATHDHHEHHEHHEHRQRKAVIDQLARTAGHVASIKRMVEEDRSCPDILIQLAAVRASIDRASRIVLEDHVESCLRGAASNGMADEEWDRLKEALDRFIH